METLRVKATIPVAGLQPDEEGDLPRQEAIDLAQGGWVTIIEKREEFDYGVSELRGEGGGDGDEPDPPREPDVAEEHPASDPVDPAGESQPG